MKNMFPLDFAKYLSYSDVQKNRKVVNIWIRFMETLYGKFLVSEDIFKLFCHYFESCR